MNKVAIIGGGPAGCICAILAQRNNPYLDITIFEKNDIASTLLPTGGGRCNLSYNENDIKIFAQNYPRGEKFLYSIFYQFFVNETLDFFSSIGIKTYTQKDNRIFPKSDKSLDVIFALKNEIKKLKIETIKKEIKEIKKSKNGFLIDGQEFNRIVIAIGGKQTPLINSVKSLGHNIIEQKPALCGLRIKENYLTQLAGVSLKQVSAKAKLAKKQISLNEDLLFTHKGISGPLAYKISSIFAKENFSENNPIILSLNFTKKENFNLQKELEINSQKEISNLISSYIPKSLTKILLNEYNISPTKKCHKINKEERIILEKILKEFSIAIIERAKDGEIVTAGGVDLKEINPKTMESRIIKHLYFCGEILDIDGFCGGFNLQNCWSTGYVAAKAIAATY